MLLFLNSLFFIYLVMIIFSPLEQFSIIKIFSIHFGFFDVSFTNSSLFILLVIIIFLFFCSFVLNSGGFVYPSYWQLLLEHFFNFVMSMIQSQLGVIGNRYVPLIFTLFSFIAGCNLIGMIPYSFTCTSHLAVTMAISFSFFFGVTLIGFARHGFTFFSLFFPSGAPIVLAPLLVILELISYSFRGVSLGVRLFANMIAGHTLVKILCGFSWAILGHGFLLTFGSLIPFFVVIALTGLEFMVGFLQAYVFCILLCIYIHDSEYLH